MTSATPPIFALRGLTDRNDAPESLAWHYQGRDPETGKHAWLAPMGTPGSILPFFDSVSKVEVKPKEIKVYGERRA